MNNKISPKEQGLIKGALRRVFSRSELRREALTKAKIQHSDPNRPRVKTWYLCSECNKPYAQHQLQIDHVAPVVPVNSTLSEMSWDELVDRLWCSADNLRVLCLHCHKAKSKLERSLRAKHKKLMKGNKTNE